LSKQGLLLKEAPEPTSVFHCHYTCKAVFYNVEEYKKHRKEVHNQRYEYLLDEYDYQYGGKGGKYHARDWSKKWVTPEKSQGRIIAPLEFSHRPIQRFGASAEQMKNRQMKNTCHCGKKFKWPRRSYCSDECSAEWNFKLTSYWSGHKGHFLDKQSHKPGKRSWEPIYTCDNCNTDTQEPEVDHIIAIILGGHPWDYRNLQLLCSECHKIKTKSDMGIYAWWKRQANYDIGVVLGNNQILLEAFLN